MDDYSDLGSSCWLSMFVMTLALEDATAAAAAAHKSILPANLMWEFCIGYIVRRSRTAA